MARLAAPLSSSSRANTVDSLYRTPSIPPPPRNHSTAQPSPGSSSDKENQQSRTPATKTGKMPEAANQSQRGPKRRRLGNLDGSARYESSPSGSEDDEPAETEAPLQDAHNGAQQSVGSGARYDPHQSMDERRELRRGYRELDKEMQDSRADWVKPDSGALEQAIVKQNLLFGNVKQTSDATIDSRILVNAGELTHKRTRALNVGETAQGIDLDEFVGKCMTYMREPAQEGISATQRRQGHTTEEEEDEQGNALDWSYLGANACFPSNARPPTIGFLLGPLSIPHRPQKPPTQRRARAKNASNVETVKAKELKASDLQQSENAGLVSICRKVTEQLVDAWEEGQRALSDFWDQKERGEITQEQQEEFDKWIWIMPDGGVDFFKFVIHPTDFGQSAENLFYTSFLIRDDYVEVKVDEETQMPSIHPIDRQIRDDSRREKGTRHQAVFALDFDTWEGLVEEFHISESMIKDRSADYAATQQPSADGWYT